MNLKSILAFLFGRPNLQMMVSSPAKDTRPLLPGVHEKRIAEARERMQKAHADRSDDCWAPTQFHS
jgi:hypothetical protein